MPPDDHFDEVALNTLLAEGVDAPTAYAASVRDETPAAGRKDRTFGILALGGLIAFILYLLIR